MHLLHALYQGEGLVAIPLGLCLCLRILVEEHPFLAAESPAESPAVHQLHIQVVNQKESEDDPSYNPIKFNLGLQGLFNNTNTAVLIAGFKNPDPMLFPDFRSHYT
jgi:hypothetical protein